MTGLGEILMNHISLYGKLSAEDREALAKLDGTIVAVPRNKDVFKRGDRPSHVVVVVSGMLQRYSIGTDGKRQIHSFYLTGDTPSLETLYIDYADNSLSAAVDSHIGLIAHDAVYRIIAERENVRALLWRETLVQAAIFRTWLTRNSTRPAHASVAHIFCEMFIRARAAGLSDGSSFRLPITQEALADALGLTSVHVNRTLMLLRDAGVIEWRGGVLSIADFEKLASIGDFDSDYLHLRNAGSGASV